MATTEQSNSTDYYYDDDSWETVTPSVIVSVVIGAVGLIANGCVLVVLLGFATLKYRPSVLLILHQTVTDAICSAMTLLTQGIYMTLDGKLEGTLGAFLCQVVLNETLMWTSFSASTFSHVSITLERYLVVVHPVFHRNHFTKRLVAVLIVLCWTLGVIFCIYYPFVSHVDEYSYCNYIYTQYFHVYVVSYFLGTVLLPMIFIIYGLIQPYDLDPCKTSQSHPCA